jgi:hypothetical protein
MPRQSISSSVPKWTVGDTTPPMRVCLTDGDGDPIDLTGATVLLNVAHASWDYYYAPQNRIINGSSCTVDPDQTVDGNRGFVDWEPSDGDLTLAGTFRFTFDITYPSAKRQTINPDATNTIIIRAPVGGMQYAS